MEDYLNEIRPQWKRTSMVDKFNDEDNFNGRQLSWITTLKEKKPNGRSKEDSQQGG